MILFTNLPILGICLIMITKGIYYQTQSFFFNIIFFAIKEITFRNNPIYIMIQFGHDVPFCRVEWSNGNSELTLRGLVGQAPPAMGIAHRQQVERAIAPPEGDHVADDLVEIGF